jgi:hypothetical protein
MNGMIDADTGDNWFSPLNDREEDIVECEGLFCDFIGSSKELSYHKPTGENLCQECIKEDNKQSDSMGEPHAELTEYVYK